MLQYWNNFSTSNTSRSVSGSVMWEMLGPRFQCFQLKSMPVVRSWVRVRNGQAKTLTGIVVTVPQKWRGEGNFPASSSAVCAEASKSIDRDCCGPVWVCAALLLPDPSWAEWPCLVEDILSWTQQLSLQPSACSRCAGSRRFILWQMLSQSCNYEDSLSFPALFLVLCKLELNLGIFVHQQLSFSSCCKLMIATHRKQEITLYCWKQQ